MSNILKITYDSTVSEEIFNESYEFDYGENLHIFHPLCTDDDQTICFPYICTFPPGHYHIITVGAQGSGDIGGDGDENIAGGKGGRAAGDIRFTETKQLFLFCWYS